MMSSLDTQRRIPIENLYYLLCYAHEYQPQQFGVDLDPEECEDSLNLLAYILGKSVLKLLHRGLEREYRAHREETGTIRGKVLYYESRRKMLDRQGKLLCDFDELTTDILPNQIICSTVDKLLRSGLLQREIRHDLQQVKLHFHQISPLKLTSAHFGRVRMHRNNRSYRMPISICKMIHKALVPSELKGTFRYLDFGVDDTTMPRLFEAFVRNFAAEKIPDAKVKAKSIPWDGNWDEISDSILPRMLTDVAIDHPDFKMILDCKFYKNALISRFQKKVLHSSHLYQLMSYLRNQAVNVGWEEVQGVLLYPAVDHNLDHSYILNGHNVRVVSIDLDKNWRSIEEELLCICRGITMIEPTHVAEN